MRWRERGVRISGIAPRTTTPRAPTRITLFFIASAAQTITNSTNEPLQYRGSRDRRRQPSAGTPMRARDKAPGMIMRRCSALGACVIQKPFLDSKEAHLFPRLTRARRRSATRGRGKNFANGKPSSLEARR